MTTPCRVPETSAEARLERSVSSTPRSSSSPPATSSTNGSSSSSASTAPAASKNAKPIKLRAACNHCFSAKVRCDGNKQGCCRCLEKRLSCVYSESRVGKVVGKRRKRPIDDSIGNINSKSWVVTTIPIQSIPSPATTQTPEDHSKRQSSQPPWATFIPTPGEPGFLTFDEPIDSLNAVDMTDHRSLSMASEFAFFNNSGLPTPALSPPHLSRYLSPAQLDSHPSLKGVHALCCQQVVRDPDYQYTHYPEK